MVSVTASSCLDSHLSCCEPSLAPSSPAPWETLPPKHRPGPHFISRLCFAGALTTLMVGSLVSVGAGADAPRALARTVDVVSRIFAPSGQPAPKVVWNSPARDQYGPSRTTVCHKSRTIVVDENAVTAHLLHGDRPGGCPSGAGILGAGRGQGSGQGRLRAAWSATPQSRTLASTGFGLGMTVVLGVMLVALGLAFRRTGRS